MSVTILRKVSVSGGTVLRAANNLGDLGSVATARTNLGLGTGDSPTFASATLNSATAVLTLGSTNTATIAVDAAGAVTITPKTGQPLTIPRKVYVNGANLRLANSYYLSGNLVDGSEMALIGFTGADKVAIDPNGYGVVLSGLAVTYGAADSGGSGYRVLRVPNS